MNRLGSLGIVVEKEVPEKMAIARLFEDLESAFDNLDVKKEDIVKIMKKYLPNFEHIETGKSLDIKM